MTVVLAKFQNTLRIDFKLISLNCLDIRFLALMLLPYESKNYNLEKYITNF